MVYGRTPFQSITNQIAKLNAIINEEHKIEFPPIRDQLLLNVLKVGFFLIPKGYLFK